ncbi:MAG: shikimate dehydrogenase [Paludibacteraceae bacterium]|nr:shikimate dehydrogenase [Paludibacteraceae bacterium]MBQ6983810.1 shikimate dehydrogenase [Paludibacteraceae bacterium]
MRHFGIIGYPLLHSFSARYFNEKFAAEKIDAEYSLFPMDNGQWTMDNGRCVRELIDSLDGMNVTLPYKQAIIPFLDRLDETAEAIGAVNVVHQRIGYNTDCLGFMESIKPLLRPEDKQALVLGTGGASKAACYGLRKLGVVPTLVSRTPREGMLGYDDLNEEVMNRHTVIVNCTPLGMLPDVDSCPPIPYERLSARHLLFDCVYNPEETLFLSKGKAQGAKIKNGMEMLYGQAKAAWKIWES